MPGSGSGVGIPIGPGVPGTATVINTETPLLSLEQWRRILAYHPWHFWGLADNNIIPVTSSCNDVVMKYAWQNTDAVGREEIIEAIKNAEFRISEQLGHWPAPKHFVQTVPWPKFHDRGLWNMSHADAQGRWLDVRVPHGYVEAVGPQSLTSLGTVDVSTTDDDGDGLNENFATTAVVTTETDANLIWAVFIAADRLDNDLANWRIHPVKVTITGGSVSVTGKYWQLVKPINYEGIGVTDIDPTVAANFASKLELYVVKTNVTGTTSATSQAMLIWETEPYPSYAACCCEASTTTNDTDPAAVAYGVARAGIRHAREGIVSVGSALYDTTGAVWKSVDWGVCHPPERVQVRYRAGYPLSDTQMDRGFQTAVARFAAAELARPLCACDEANRELYRWQFDLARTGGANDESYTSVTVADLDNPFGTRRGQVYAWRFVKDNRNVIGFSM